MKKQVFFYIAACIVFLTACEKDEEKITPTFTLQNIEFFLAEGDGQTNKVLIGSSEFHALNLSADTLYDYKLTFPEVALKDSCEFVFQETLTDVDLNQAELKLVSIPTQMIDGKLAFGKTAYFPQSTSFPRDMKDIGVTLKLPPHSKEIYVVEYYSTPIRVSFKASYKNSVTGKVTQVEGKIYSTTIDETLFTSKDVKNEQHVSYQLIPGNIHVARKISTLIKVAGL